jgi:probable F420-dependent oxidoreductase
VPGAATPILDLAFHGDPSGVVAIAREAEARGVGALFVAEAAHDPYVALALGAASTRRITLGTSVSGGRLVLGLGTQIKPHITRRFAMPWSSPAPRMAEYVEALRVIWDSWQTGAALDFRGSFYEHTLMPPMFDPGPIGEGPPPVWLAAVGPRMLAVAGAVADGLICHPLLSRSYLADVVLPTAAAARAGGSHAEDPFTIASLCLVATGRTEEQLAAAIAGVRKQIGFYASTPAYQAVLDHHGWGELHHQAHAFTRAGRWQELGDLVDDEVLAAFAVVGELDEARSGLRERFAGLAQRCCPSMPYDADELLALDLVGPR